MADPNAFPNKELEDLNLKIKKKVDEVLKNIDTQSINEKVQEKIKKMELPSSKIEVGEDEKWTGTAFIPNRQYVESLPNDYRQKVLLYYDIFKENPEIVTDYVETLKKHGSEKAAVQAGSTNLLLFPYDKTKLKTHVSNNRDLFSENTQKRLEFLDKWGDKKYNLMIREDDEGRKIQKEWSGRWRTKTMLGLGEPVADSARFVSKTILQVAAAVGSENAANAVNWLEANWPRADDLTYPNQFKPFDQDSTYQHLIDEMAQFGIDWALGGKLLKAFGWTAKKAAPGTFKKFSDWALAKVPAKTKAGKEIADSYGNIKYVSSIAQKSADWGIPLALRSGWGAPVAAKYGLGRMIAEDEQTLTFSEGFGWMSPMDRERWNKMTGKEKAIESLKRKLIHGAEGTVLIGGLTKAIGTGGKVLWGGTKWAGRTVAVPADKLIFNPIGKIAASRKTGIPQLVKGIRNSGGFIADKVLKIPPYKKWAYFNTTQGPLKERLLGLVESHVLPPLRVRGPWTKEAKQIMLAGEQMIRKYKKDVGLLISRIDRAVYHMLNKGLANRAFTTSSVGAGRQHWDDVIAFLKGEVKIDALPTVLREPAKDIQKLIEKLSKEIKPYVKNEEIKKEIIDGMGKYLTTSYKIFQGSWRPGQKEIAGAQQYFVDLLKKNKEFKNVKKGSALEQKLWQDASKKVDEILQYGKEGSSPAARLSAVTGLVKPDKILAKKEKLPEVIEKLLGKVDDPISIIMDTVSGQAELLSHLFTHKSILREGLKSGWITTDPKKFAMQGVQKPVAKSLVPIKEIMRTSNIDIAKIYTPAAGKKAGNFWTTPEIAAALKQDALWTDFLLQQSWYKPILASKTAAQLSKTVLSLMTQARNFETAMFFSIMQGHVGSQASVMEAMKFVFGDVIGKGRINPVAMRRKLTEWSDVGILDSSIVGGEITAVIGDITKGKFSNTEQLFKAMLQNPVFRKATEFYQGSDSVWKAYGYEFTKSQLLAAIPIRGLTVENAKRLGYVVEAGRKKSYTWADLVSKQFDEVFGMKWDPLKIDGVSKSYGDALKEIAGKYIRDVYPNYNIVPNLVAGWRRLPMGNFIAFRSENIRNVYNTMVYSMREMSSSNPFLRQMGARRMVGLSTTLYGIEEGLRAFTGALTNIDAEWMKKYQRWFSPWYDKTSTLFPVTKVDPETKKFWTLNWTREQPYEGVQDAFAVMFQQLFNPVKDDEAMFSRFFKAFFYDFDEEIPGGLVLLFEPFINPALLIESIQDIAPVSVGGLGRGGVTKEGKIIFDPVNDSKGEILAKMFAHLLLDINPATIKNAKQVIDAAEGILTPSGVELNTLNQITKLVLGIGLEEQNPLKNMTYTVGNATGRLKKVSEDFRNDARSVTKLLQDPFLVKKEFNNLQENRYRELSRMYEFVTFLKDGLKMTRAEIMWEFKKRGGFSTKTINMMLNGTFNPANLPPIEPTSLYPKILKRINATDKYKDNPLTLKDIYDRKELFFVKNKWMNVPLGLNDKELEEYFITGKDPRKEKDEVIEEKDTSMILPDTTESKTQLTELITTPNNQAVETANVSQEVVKTAAVPTKINPNTGLTRIEDALLSNEEKAIRLKNRGVTV